MDHKGGLIIVDKPAGVTSAGAVEVVKRALRAQKAGHLGTLDPDATGVLVVAVNRTTKLIPFLERGDKSYYAVVKLGQETDTLDAAGSITRSAPLDRVDYQSVVNALAEFQGRILQTPPMYSAVKKNGRPLYQMARAGLEVERTPREVDITELKLHRYDLPYIYISISCSGGTYIRCLAADLGRKLGCGAHLFGLRRVHSGDFGLERSVMLSAFAARDPHDLWSEYAYPFDQVLDFLPQVEVKPEALKPIRDGRPVTRELCLHFPQGALADAELVALKCNQSLIAVASPAQPNRVGESGAADEVLFQLKRVLL